MNGRDMQGCAVSGNLWKVNIYSFRIYSAEITDLFGADWKIILLRMKNRSPENDFRFCGPMEVVEIECVILGVIKALRKDTCHGYLSRCESVSGSRMDERDGMPGK